MQKSCISQNEKFDVHDSPEEAEAEVEWFYEDLQDLVELTHKKDEFIDLNKKIFLN